ncbi:helix-turn-helix transcriptional regulator [Dongia deserti]|uniref:helix-turn-helix transcriptional regulator n=1 Tax=Dongia deserti TaxID=2268030 RepID=UPI000E646493|nr:WYL domain-containing protein [Dongia deserti]
MTRRAIPSRLHRLEELKGLLKAREHVTAAELSAELGVSIRTLNRDLEILRDSGVPIDSDRGRGGGLRLQRNWALGRLHLSPAEAIDLLLSIAIAERMNSPLLLQQLAAIKRKIVAAFSESYQGKIRALRKRILVGAPASERVIASFSPPQRSALTGIAEAFFNTRCVAIEYVDQNGVVTSREVEPQFLYLNVPVWYLLAWDRLRGAVRFFRIDRIRSVKPLQASFRLADPRPFLAEAEEGIEVL